MLYHTLSHIRINQDIQHIFSLLKTNIQNRNMLYKIELTFKAKEINKAIDTKARRRRRGSMKKRREQQELNQHQILSSTADHNSLRRYM
jgi:hypothetical protein